MAKGNADLEAPQLGMVLRYTIYPNLFLILSSYTRALYANTLMQESHENAFMMYVDSTRQLTADSEVRLSPHPPATHAVCP